MIVIFDTNIWKANLYLRSPASAAVQLYLKNKGARIALPEVIQLEVESHLRIDLRRYRDNLKTDHDRLLALFGRLHEILLPTDFEIDDLARSFFGRSGFKFEEVPFTLEAARDSFLRTVEKRPPSEDSQQFKDGIIWANCVALAEQDEVMLVTNDRAFFESGNQDTGLSAKLQSEAASSIYGIRLIPTLGKLLEEIREPISADPITLAAEIRKALADQIDGIVMIEEMVEGDSAVTAEYFASEIPNLAYVVFDLQIGGRSARVDSPTVIINVRGECGWNVDDDIYSNFKPSEIQVIRLSPDGTEVSDGKHVFLYADGLAIGRRDVHYSLREKIG